MQLVILGFGGFGRSVYDIANDIGDYSSIVVLDDDIYQPMVVGTCASFDTFIDSDTVFFPAFGNNELRYKWITELKKMGCRLAKIIHPSAYVGSQTIIEPGCIVMPHACIGTSCHIYSGCIVNMGSIVDHGCVLEQCVHIAPGAIVKADNRIPMETKIDSGMVVQNGKYR